jgi:hypothetical protein
VKQLPIDLKVVKTARKISTYIFGIAYGYKSKRRVICPNILTKVTGLRIIPLKKRP